MPWDTTQILAAMQSQKLYGAEAILFELDLPASCLKATRAQLLDMARKGLLVTALINHTVLYGKP